MRHRQKIIALLVSVLVVIVVVGIAINQTQKPDGAGRLAPKGVEVPFTTVSQGYNSGYRERGEYIVKDSLAWQNIWETMHATVEPKPPIPAIDFTDEFIIAVFQGTQATGGYSTWITKIVDDGDTWGVSIVDVVPGNTCVVTQALTEPYHIVKLEKAEKEIRFVREEKVEEC